MPPHLSDEERIQEALDMCPELTDSSDEPSEYIKALDYDDYPDDDDDFDEDGFRIRYDRSGLGNCFEEHCNDDAPDRGWGDYGYCDWGNGFGDGCGTYETENYVRCYGDANGDGRSNDVR